MIAGPKFALYFLIACLLIPEIIISGACANTAIPAFALLCLIFYLLAKSRPSFPLLAVTSVFMAVSFYVRSDTALMAPAVMSLRSMVSKMLPLGMPFVILIESLSFVLCFIPLFIVLSSGIGLSGLILSPGLR